MGFDDRAQRKTERMDQKPPQLQGHTKTYTKVVLEQNETSLGG